MKLVDILNGEPGLYLLNKPSCDPAYPAYGKWEGVVIRKTSNQSIRFHDPAFTNYNSGDLVKLNGIVVKSEWLYLGRD